MSDPSLETLLAEQLGFLGTYVACRLDRELRLRESTDDVVQSAVRELLANPGEFRYQGPEAFRAFLVRVVEYKIAKKRRYWQAQKRGGRAAPGGSQDAEPLADLDAIPASSSAQPTPSEAAAQNEALLRLRDAMDELDEEDRRILTMRRIGELSTERIAEELGLSASTVRRRVGEILTRIGRRLEGGLG